MPLYAVQHAQRLAQTGLLAVRQVDLGNIARNDRLGAEAQSV